MKHELAEKLYDIAASGCHLGNAWEWENRFIEATVRECISLFDGSKEMKTSGMISHQSVVDQIKKHFDIL